MQHHRLCLAHRNARNSALSKPDRPPTSQVWRQSPDSQGVRPAALSFEAVAPTSGQALYMPALVAARFNPDMKAKYAHTSSKPKTRQKSP